MNKLKRNCFVSILLFISVSLLSFSLSATEKFPLRKKYSSLPVIELAELEKSYGNVTIVDVRSKFEYDTLRIKGAVHVPLALGRAFKAALNDLISKSNKTIIFYCNGTTCSKSYKAGKLAKKNRVTNFKVFDLGVMGWANKNPDKSVLLGKSPIDTSKLIAKSDYKKKLIPLADFKAKLTAGSVLIDIRNKYQKKGKTNLFGGKSVNINIDDAKSELAKLKGKHQTFLIYDAVGKQVRWLQYAIEELGIKNYFFLKDGAKAFSK